MKNKILLILIATSLLFTFTACQQLDVIGNGAVSSFKNVLDSMPDSNVYDKINEGWTLTAPDKTEKFFLSKDFTKNPIFNAMLVIDAKPFINAGLDVNKLSEVTYLDGNLIVGIKMDEELHQYNQPETPIESFKEFVRVKRDAVGYHADLDHYGVNLGNGNMFEWAKDMSTNDKDIVFVLNPKPFIDAGVDPEKVKGWTYAKVPMMDAKGKKIEVDKLLKPFNLK